ncbi:dihydroxyacetonephosphate acetyltransferase [Leishmania mexicana MHOM/GT/2001/U1103]|uniref:Dihydroxyacetonephosphate acetyltransferase n=1 Tax=Leishmania mexicana (strain MHOM/GT/2001/U1103) TaxID=929439 RepID=E9B4T0_LEIMU|nr:dihydroxyacetonephosphate acetyltransferase [Leishmania mexicana MHOM/GT/2001/U1103]CBZ30249.1 dihydroxyacetonephosphate acetyltransferase [Leishmania mexicana MHOM/GT/2001/U1103]
MSFPPPRLALPEECKQVVLVAPIDGLTAACACAIATSPLVPLNCRVLVDGIPVKSSSPSSGNDSPHTARSSAEAAATTRDFMGTVHQVEAKLRASRAARRGRSMTHMTQFYYGGVSPKAEEIGPMLHRIYLLGSGALGETNFEASSRDVTAGSDGSSGVPSVADSVFVLVLSAQSLSPDTESGLRAYDSFLRRLWSDAGASQAAETASQQTRVRGSLVILADDVYRPAACAMLSSIAKEVATAVDWVVLLAYAYAMDPPALEFGATEAAVQAASGISHGGTLPVLCAANALGVLRHFPVSRSEPATITPVDVALNAAFLGYIWLWHGELPECVECAEEMQYCGSSPASSHAAAAAETATATATATSTPPAQCVTRHCMASFAVAESRKPGEASLVWGMVGEYLMSYYGRFADQISSAFPVAGVLTPAPILQFPFSVADLVNFGPEPRAAAYALEGWRAYQRRQRLIEEISNAEAAQALKAYVTQMDSVVRYIERAARVAAAQDKASAAFAATRRRTASSSFSAPPYRLDDFNLTLYHSLLRRLTSHYTLMPYHQCVALVEVDWEAYVSVIARAVLEHLARCVLRSSSGLQHAGSRSRAPQVADSASIVRVVRDSPVVSAAAKPEVAASAAEPPFAFPEPRRYFTNDFVFHGAERIPPFPSRLHKYFDCFVFLHRIGMTANGWRGDMTPGMTPQVLTSIIAQPDIQRLMTALAAKDGASKKDVEARAKSLLLQCGDALNHVHCRAMGLMIRAIFRSIYGRVDVNNGAYERLHRYFAMPRVAVVFVPLHRSYIDFLILSEVLALMRLPLPHIVAGEDFLSMGIFATLMRGSGAFFMRRSFRDDPLYAALLKEYVRHLVRARRPIEFFIEGTRSRTGKTMAPKLGLLKFVCNTFYEPGQQELDDVLIMPVSLTYDEVLEATTHAKELLGVPKPRENPTNMLKARSLLERMHGNINIHIGEPVSLRSLKEHPRQCPLPFQPKGEQLQYLAAPASATASVCKTLDTTPSIAKGSSITPIPLLTTVAWHIMYKLQRNTIITPASMVAAVVECLGPYYCTATTRSKKGSDTTAAAAMPLEKVHQGVKWLRSRLCERGAQLSVEASELSPAEVVTLALTNLYRYIITDEMSNVTYRPDDVVTRLAVNISTNQLIHVCMDEALVAVVAQAFGSATTPHRPPSGADGAMLCGVRSVKTDVLSNQTQLLQRLLSVEFPNYAEAAPVSFASWLDCTVSQFQQCVEEHTVSSQLSGADTHGDTVVHVPVTQYYYFLLQLICPHVEALYTVVVAASALLAAYPGQPLGAADVVTATQRACGTLYAEHKLRYVVAANRETLQHYYESLIALSLLQIKRVPATTAPGQSKVSRGVVAYTVGLLGQEAVLARLEMLSAQIQALWWHPSAAEGMTIDKAAIQERVLAVYRELTQPSKM